MLLIPLILSIAGCDLPETEYIDGPKLTESAQVYDMGYAPKSHGIESTTDVSFNLNDGSISTVPTVRQTDIPESFWVIFKCQHGKFVISGEKGEALYKKLDRGIEVSVSYVRKMKISRESSKTDWTTNFIGFGFIDATPHRFTAETESHDK